MLLTAENVLNELFTDICDTTEKTASTGVLSWDAILVFIILGMTLYGVFRGGFQMIAPVISFIAARIFTPAVQGVLRGCFLESVVDMYTESYMEQYPEGFPFATELLDVVSNRMLEIISFIIALAIIRLLVGFVFYKIGRSFLAGVPNSIIGGIIGFVLAIFFISVGTRILAYASPMSESAANAYNGISATPIGGSTEKVASFLFKELQEGLEAAEPVINDIQESVDDDTLESKAMDFVNGAVLNNDEIPEDLND